MHSSSYPRRARHIPELLVIPEMNQW